MNTENSPKSYTALTILHAAVPSYLWNPVINIPVVTIFGASFLLVYFNHGLAAFWFCNFRFCYFQSCIFQFRIFRFYIFQNIFLLHFSLQHVLILHLPILHYQSRIFSETLLHCKFRYSHKMLSVVVCRLSSVCLSVCL